MTTEKSKSGFPALAFSMSLALKIPACYNITYRAFMARSKLISKIKNKLVATRLFSDMIESLSRSVTDE
jgi:hypothetical protein